MDLKSKIRTIEDFPVEGINFRDITTLLKDGEAFHQCIEELKEIAQEFNPGTIVGIEARGFIIGSALAYAMGIGFIPVRKPGKLPGDVLKESYGLEYGQDSVEIHKDALSHNGNVLIVDDLLATGGTALATAKMLESLGANVLGALFFIELTDLKGRDQLKDYKVASLLTFREDEK